MPRVELIYDADCPNVLDARRVLEEAFSLASLEPSWTEWERSSPGSPPHVRGYGSPTILVDGRDLAGAEPTADGCDACRVYDHGGGVLRGVPRAAQIAAALGHLREPPKDPRAERGRVWSALASLPGIGAALLPAGACPACWPAYSGILGSLGLGFLVDATYLFPVTAALFALALFALAFRAKTREGYGPLAAGAAAAALVLVFKFVHPFDTLVYAGLAGLIGASVWNAWPRNRPSSSSCPQCAQAEPRSQCSSAPVREPARRISS
jgi:hypothetical protein